MVDKLIGQLVNLSLALGNTGSKDVYVYPYISFTRSGHPDIYFYRGWWLGARSAGFPGYLVRAHSIWNRTEPISVQPNASPIDEFTPNPLSYGDYDLEMRVALADPAGANKAWNESRLGSFEAALPIVGSKTAAGAVTVQPRLNHLYLKLNNAPAGTVWAPFWMGPLWNPGDWRSYQSPPAPQGWIWYPDPRLWLPVDSYADFQGVPGGLGSFGFQIGQGSEDYAWIDTNQMVQASEGDFWTYWYDTRTLTKD